MLSHDVKYCKYSRASFLRLPALLWIFKLIQRYTESFRHLASYIKRVGRFFSKLRYNLTHLVSGNIVFAKLTF